MFAVVETGGKQYKVAPGDQLDVELLGIEAGQQFDLGRVLMVGSNGGEVLVGSPLVDGARVVATVVAEHRGDKLIVFKYKPKKRYRRKNGHRQMLTRVSIDDIFADGIADTAQPEAKPKKVTTVAPSVVETEQPITEQPIIEASTAPAAESVVEQPVAEVGAASAHVVDTGQPIAEVAAAPLDAAATIAPSTEVTAAPAAAEATISEPQTVITSTPIVELRGVPTTDTIGSGLSLQDALNTDEETEEGKA